MSMILEWIAVLFFLYGTLLLARKKATDPKTRMRGLFFLAIGGMFLTIWCCIEGASGLLVFQIISEFIDTWGMCNCKKEMRKDEGNRF